MLCFCRKQRKVAKSSYHLSHDQINGRKEKKEEGEGGGEGKGQPTHDVT